MKKKIRKKHYVSVKIKLYRTNQLKLIQLTQKKITDKKNC